MVPSFAFRGPKGAGKRTQLLRYLEERATQLSWPFHVKESTWYLTKPSNGSANPDDEDDDGSASSKSIPYEESALHLGFDVARMSMSDKMFLQSILSRWTGQQDVTLLPREHHTDVTRDQCTNSTDTSAFSMRYLVLYHAQYLTDESTLQLQEALEQFPSFAILLTTELPVCGRLRDACLEIPVSGVEGDRLLTRYAKAANLPATDVWLRAVQATLDSGSHQGGTGLDLPLSSEESAMDGHDSLLDGGGVCLRLDDARAAQNIHGRSVAGRIGGGVGSDFVVPHSASVGERSSPDCEDSVRVAQGIDCTYR